MFVSFVVLVEPASCVFRDEPMERSPPSFSIVWMLATGCLRQAFQRGRKLIKGFREEISPLLCSLRAEHMSCLCTVLYHMFILSCSRSPHNMLFSSVLQRCRHFGWVKHHVDFSENMPGFSCEQERKMVSASDPTRQLCCSASPDIIASTVLSSAYVVPMHIGDLTEQWPILLRGHGNWNNLSHICTKCNQTWCTSTVDCDKVKTGIS